MPAESPSLTVPDAATAGRIVRRSVTLAGGALLPVVLFAGLAAAQTNATGATGSSFCGTSMATTIKNMFTLIQFGGPLVGGVLALGATVAIPFFSRSDMKTIRNQGLVYGVLVSPLGTEIVQFLLNNIVAGGSSCAF